MVMRQYAKWLPSEDAYIRAHINFLTHAEMGAELGRSMSAVAARCRILKVYRPSRWL